MKSQRILILGLGGVGHYLALRLANEGHAITVIESRRSVIRRADSEMDVRFIHGNALDPARWKEADAPRMHYLIAVTDDDAVNVLASLIADRLGVPRKIARVRTHGLLADSSVLSPEDVKLDLVIQPEELAAQEVSRLLKMRSGNVVIDLADGEMQVMAARITEESLLAHRTVKEIANDLRGFDFRVVALARGINTVIPGGSDELRPNDQVFILARAADLPSLMLFAGMGEKERPRVMIIGGGATGSRIAELLQDSFTVKLIERNGDRAEELFQRLKDVELLNGDGADSETLLTAGLLSMDTVITATSDNETNIMTSVLAKHLIRNQTGDRRGKECRTIALVDREQYLTLAASIGSDIVLNKKVLAADEILVHIRKGEMLSVAHLHGVDAEVVEMIVDRRAPITKAPLSSLPGTKELRGRMIIGCVFQQGQWRTASGSTKIEPGDRIIGVCQSEHLPELERWALG